MRLKYWIVGDAGVSYGPLTQTEARKKCLPEEAMFPADNAAQAKAMYTWGRDNADCPTHAPAASAVFCPRCGMEDTISEIDRVEGTVGVTAVQPSGEIEFCGDTELDWNSQQSKDTPTRFWCSNCQAEDILLHELAAGVWPDHIERVTITVELSRRNLSYPCGRLLPSRLKKVVRQLIRKDLDSHGLSAVKLRVS